MEQNCLQQMQLHILGAAKKKLSLRRFRYFYIYYLGSNI